MERESPAERTDPLLPVITADLVPPVTPPALDDRRLAGLLAELDDEDMLPGDAPAEQPASAPAEQPADVPAGRLARPAEKVSPPAAQVARPVVKLPAPRAPRPDPPPVPPLVVDSTVVDSSGVDPAPTRDPADRYVRRDYRPTELPADAMGLTGLSRVGESRVGTVVFTAFFLGIFLLILVEVVVSLLRAA